jgi:hypothetical protein|tara:strand:- start:447 stop:800 length:354 start_codon:yes stop_codon:yes gene_type:complete
MATQANWSVIFDDKIILKNFNEGATEALGYKVLDDDAFWATTAFQNIWAIQSGTPNSSDEVEHRDETPHCSLADEGIDIQLFVNKWDSAHLSKLQADWDSDDREESEKGSRPTSYSS